MEKGTGVQSNGSNSRRLFLWLLTDNRQATARHRTGTLANSAHNSRQSPVLTFATSRRPPQEAHSSRAGGVRLCLQVGNGQGVECAGRGGQNPGLRAPGARRFLGQVSSDGQPAVRPSHCSESSSKKIGRSQRKEGRWAGRVNSEYCSNQTRETLGTDTGRDEETRVCARGPMRGPCVARRGQAPHSDRTAPRAPGHRDS